MNKFIIQSGLILCLILMFHSKIKSQTVIGWGKAYSGFADWLDPTITGTAWYNNVDYYNKDFQLTAYHYFKNKLAILYSKGRYNQIFYGNVIVGTIDVRDYHNYFACIGYPVNKRLYLFVGPSYLIKYDDVVTWIYFWDINSESREANVFGITTQLDYEAIHYKHLSVHTFARYQAHQNTTAMYVAGLNVGYKFNWKLPAWFNKKKS